MYKNVIVDKHKMDVSQYGTVAMSWRPSASRPNACFSLYKVA